MSAAPARRAEAKTIADAIVRSANDLYVNLLAFAEIRGWEALGFKSFGAWADENMPVSRWVAYQELAKAKALGGVARALNLPLEEVTQYASALPQGEASAVAAAIEDDDEIVDAVIVDTASGQPEEVLRKLRATVGRRISPDEEVRGWAVRCRKLPYPDPLTQGTRDVLFEAQDYIRDCLASWEEPK